MSTWVLLRGLTRESRHWGDFPHRLRAALPPGAVLVAPDLPGNGRRHREASPGSVAALAEDCRAQLLADGHAPPYHLLSMSLGAMVAVAWAARWPRELAGAVLINTSLRPFSPLPQRLRPSAWPSLLRLAATDPSNAAWERAILRLTSRTHAGAPSPLLAQWTALRAAAPVSRVNAWRQLWAAARFRAPRACPPVPMLVLASARDGLVDARCSRALAAAWSVPLALHPRGGHDLSLDDPDWVVERVVEWLAAEFSPAPPEASD